MKELRKVGLAKCGNADTYEWWKSLRTQTCWDAEMAQLLEQPVGLSQAPVNEIWCGRAERRSDGGREGRCTCNSVSAVCGLLKLLIKSLVVHRTIQIIKSYW